MSLYYGAMRPAATGTRSCVRRIWTVWRRRGSVLATLTRRVRSVYPTVLEAAGLPDATVARPAAGSVQHRMRAMLFDMLDPVATDREARDDQARMIERHGGREAVIKRGAFDNSPVPGEEPEFRL